MSKITSAVLTESQVSEIRLRVSVLGQAQTHVAQTFNVGRSTVGDVVNYRTWKNVAGPTKIKAELYQLADGRVYYAKSKKFLQVSLDKNTKKKYVSVSNSKGDKVKVYLAA